MTATVSARRAPLGHATAAVGLAMLMGLQPATTDIYLPALPALTKALAAPMALAQLTLSALILAFGFGQLVLGPVADRFGRRPVLLVSLALYTLASLAGALAANIGMLIACRAAQGLTMAGALVCSRAIVRDLYDPFEGAQVMALALSGLGLVAIGGPMLGGLVASHAGWRATLVVVALYGTATLAFVAWRLPETLAARNPHAIAIAPMMSTWARIGRHPGFIAWTLHVACTYGGIFTYLAGSSFVFIGVLGLSSATYGLAMGSVSVAYLVGTLVCRRWIARLGITRTVARGAAFSAAAALGLAATGFADWRSPWALLLPQWLYAFGHGIHMPCGQSGTVAAFPQHAGAASALAGFVMSVIAFGIGRWLGVALDDSVRPFALTIAFWAAATALVAWTLVQRHGRAA